MIKLLIDFTIFESFDCLIIEISIPFYQQKWLKHFKTLRKEQRELPSSQSIALRSAVRPLLSIYIEHAVKPRKNVLSLA